MENEKTIVMDSLPAKKNEQTIAEFIAFLNQFPWDSKIEHDMQLGMTFITTPDGTMISF